VPKSSLQPPQVLSLKIDQGSSDDARLCQNPEGCQQAALQQDIGVGPSRCQLSRGVAKAWALQMPTVPWCCKGLGPPDANCPVVLQRLGPPSGS